VTSASWNLRVVRKPRRQPHKGEPSSCFPKDKVSNFVQTESLKKKQTKRIFLLIGRLPMSRPNL